MAGLTSDGLVILTLGDVLDDLRAQWREAFGASLDVSDRSPDGQMIGIISEPFALNWELLEAIVASQDPDKATGGFLDSLCALSGTVRPPATFSAVVLTLSGTPTTPIAAGSLASSTSTGQQWTWDEETTIVAVDDWAALTPYVSGAGIGDGDRVTNAGNVYLCIVPGASAASGGPTTESDDITDGSCHWRFLGQGTGAVDVLARARVTGPIAGISGDIANIDTPIGGWDGVINILDATLGRLRMNDPQLRILREQEVARPGTSPQNAIRAALLDVDRNTPDPVTSATVFVNNSDFTDVDEVPGHSIEPLVRGGSDQAIWDALLANVAAGVRTHGTEIGTSLDSEGVAQTMAFSRPVELLIYVDVTLSKDPSVYPTDGDDQVKAAISTGGNDRDDGVDVVSAKLIKLIDSVPGILDIDLPLISVTPVTVPVATTTIPVTLRQRAVFDTTRITVTSSDGTP